MSARLENKRVLVTQASAYMGPAIGELFRQEGAHVLADDRDLTKHGACEQLIAEAGPLDVLIANLAHPPKPAPVAEIADADWHALFDSLVHPLMRLVRATTPQLIAQGRGKIVAITSAAPLRGIPNTSAYCAARGAQNAFVRAIGLELAPHNVQCNAVAQNYVRNDSYFPSELVDSERFAKHLARNVPAKRLAHGWESAELALFLASEKSDFMCGQVVPFAGGWA
jgi:NAD(P)-dependent dehydrogenase (short-subunit alcohol dehydrogenase family)